MLNPSASSIAAVIVTYNPPDGLAERVQTVLEQVGRLIVVDNASSEPTQRTLAALEAGFPGRIGIIRNSENRGLSLALNQGIRQALAHNAEWVLLLDHDSHPASDMIARMMACYATYPEPQTVGLIAPEIFDVNTSLPTRYLMPHGRFGFKRLLLEMPYNDRVSFVITSGSLIKASLFQDIGFMPDHFFIDYIDGAFCLRLKKRGYRILLVKGAKLRHRLGEKRQSRVLGVTMTTSQHAATRRFYIFRNRIWLWKRYGMSFPHFLAHDMLAAGFDIVRIVLMEDQKAKKLGAIARGVWAGLCPEPK